MMKRPIAIFLTCLLLSTVIPAQTPQQPQKPKVRLQTPFGPIEVDFDDPRVRTMQVIGEVPPPAGAPVAQPAPQSPAAPAPAATPAGAAPAAPPAPQASPDDAAPIALHLDNTDIYQVIRIIGDALQLNYVIDPSIRGTVNINAGTNLKRSDLLPILEAILKINGATMVRNGNFYQIVPANSAIRQPLEVRDGRPESSPDDQIVIQIIRMKFILATDMGRLLNPYLSEGANIVVHDAGNILLVSERRSNLRKLLEIIDVFDTNVFEGERIRMFQVKDVLARDVVGDLERIFAGYGFSTSSSAIRFLAIDRLNAVLVISSNPTVFPEVEKWVARLEDPGPTAGVRNYVYKVKNSKAVSIQRVLTELYGVSQQSQQQAFGQQQALPTAGMAVPGAPAGAVGATAPVAGAGQLPQNQGRPGVRIIADEPNNALVIQAAPQDYAEIERTIQELDVLRRQVLIDAQIFEVNLDHGLTLGISAFLQARSAASSTTTAAFGSGSGGGTPSATLSTFALIGRTRELLLFLNASENRSRVRTLSAPSVLVSDNMTAEFQVGAEVPIPTTSSVTPVQSGGTNLFAQTIQFRNTGTILRVKPQINDSGVVTMEISQEVSQAGSNTTSAIVAPVIGKSSVSSTIVIRDGETIALSGFIRENNELSRSRFPLLGDIPGLGILFGNTRRSNTRSELIVLITPHVARNFDETNAASDELRTKLKEIQKMMK